MPRFKQIAQIQQLMSKKELVRNIGIIAHIDHGKTTLADSLLASAGLISPQMAGSARVLDYLEEEQKRKITIKTANVTLLYKSAENEFIINLVDTPGHVDFTGKVTRALRAIDGVVVLVDAVEEIMAQTEILTRQALGERVRPVLFINKVDRLITELQLSAEQIELKLNCIIDRFNDLIELYGEESLKDEWKVDPANGSVAFGSALHRWGFTLDVAKNKSMKFSDIVSAYIKPDYAMLQRLLPVHEAVFEMAVKSLPNPKKAQSYRVERIWSGAVRSKIGRSIAECSDDQLAIVCVTNVQPETDGGSMATGRVFSGTVKPGDKLYCVNALKETMVDKVYVSMGSFKEEVSQVSAGNIAIVKVSDALAAGETLVDMEHKSEMVPFEAIHYVSEPVLTVAIEPKNPKDIFTLLKTLNKLVTEDPNLAFSVDKETGEHLLSVMGELHLEVALSQLKTASGGLGAKVSSPRVVYRESVTKRGIEASARSPNKQNSFVMQVETAEEQKISQIRFEESGNVLSVDEQRNVLLDCSGKTGQLDAESLASLIAGFEFACKAGPLCREPMRHVKVSLADLQLSGNASLRPSVEIMHGVGKAIFGSFLTAKPVLLEPVYKMVISVPTELAGECSRILGKRRAKISGFEERGFLTVVTGYIPVSETLGLSEEMRSATSGRAIWQNVLDRWEKIPQKLAAKVIGEIRKRKGLPAEVPEATKFLEGRQG